MGTFINAPGFADDVRTVLQDLLNLPPDFMNYTVQYAAVNPLSIPISQVTGFMQFTANISQVGSEEGTTSQTFTDLATVGPELEALADGQYAILFGASMQAPTSQDFLMGLSINGDAVDADHVCETEVMSNLSLAHGLLTTLDSGSNSIVTKYRITGGSSPGDARYRWLLALKYADL